MNLLSSLLEFTARQIARLDGRVDDVVSSATVDSELIDIRNGIDGRHYASAGAAVRGQYTQIQQRITSLNSDRILEIANLQTHKVAQPLDDNNQPTNGTSGQSLRTKGDGTTEWADVGLPTDEQTAQAISDWLDAHPEATTTVEDGSLTLDKFSPSLQTLTMRGALIPDMYSGSDSQKLQSCFDALSGTGGTILINREYTLDSNISISNNSNQDNPIFVIGSGQEASIDMDEYSFVGSVSDVGGLMFLNLKFTGTETAFETSNLIRLYFTNCYFNNFRYVFSCPSNKYVQTVYLTACVLRRITTVFNLGSAYDLKAVNCNFEWCGGLLNVKVITGSSFNSNLIEGFTGVAFTVSERAYALNITNNYFEENGATIDLSTLIDTRHQNIVISNNVFVERVLDDPKHIITLPLEITEAGTICIQSNTQSRTDLTNYLIYVDDSATYLKGVNLLFNNGQIYDTNHRLVDVYPTIKDAVFVNQAKNQTIDLAVSGVALAISSSRLYFTLNLPFVAKNTDYTVSIVRIGTIVNIGAPTDVVAQTKSENNIFFYVESSGLTAGTAYYWNTATIRLKFA